MSINFQKPLDDETQKKVSEKLKEVFGNPVASDKSTFLYDRLDQLNGKLGVEVAKAANQPIDVELNATGTTKVVQGIPYVLTEKGWKKQY